MYQEVAFLAGSTEKEFTPFHFPLENQQEVVTKKGVFFKRQRLLRRPNEAQEENDLSAVINVGGIRYRIHRIRSWRVQLDNQCDAVP